MTKMKKFLALLASLTAVATLGLATACGDKGDSSTPVDSTPPASTPGDSTPDDSTPVEKQYTVTVKKPDGTPAAGYWLRTCVGDNCSTPDQTDANGVFTFTFEEDATVYHVQAANGGGDDYANYEAVDFPTVPGTLTYEVTLVEKAPVVVSNTVAEVIAGENDAEFVLTGTVLANSGKGCVLADATGSIFVYGTTDANVGDIVKVTGTRATFGNCVQLKPTAVEAAEGTAIQAGAIKELTAADCDAYKAAQSMVPEYVSFVGTLAVSGKYYNITIDGTEVVGSLVTPTDADKAILADLNGKTVKVEGYVVYVTSGKYLYSIATNISEVVVEETIATPISGTGTYDDAYVIEAGKTYVASKEVQDSVYFTLSNAEAGTYTFNLPETNEGVPYIEIIGGPSTIENGTTFVAKAGAVINLVISNSDWDENWNTIFFDTTFSLDFVAGDITPDGSELAPITVANGQTYTVGSWEGLWYTFTAPSAGQYKLTLDDWAAQADNFNFFDADYNTFNRGVAIDIAEGETVSFKAYSYLDNESTWTFSFGETLSNDENCDTVIDESIPGSSEENPLSIEAAGDYEITVLAGADFYAQFLGGAFQFVVPEGLTVYTLGMNSGMFSAGETVAFTSYAMWNSVMYFTIRAAEDTTVTLSVSEYVMPVAIFEGENLITITEDILETGVECTFTAYVTGQYTFASNDLRAIVYDSNDMQVGMGIVNLTAGETYKVLVGGMAVGEYTLTITAPEDTGEEGGDVIGGSDTDGILEVGVAEKIQITAENIDEEHGVSLTFTPDTYGKYQFKGDLKTVVYDNDTLDLITATSGQYTLQAGKEYWIIAYNFMPNVFQPGEYTITAELKEVLSEGGNEEVEADGSEEAPFVIEDLFAAPIVTKTGINDPDMVWYTFTLTEGKTLVFTFDNTDSWFRVKSESGEVVVSGYSQAVFEGTLSAGKYTMGIASWDFPNDALSLTVTEKVAEGGDDVGGDTAGVAIRITFPGKEKYAGEWSSASKCATVADAASATTYYMEDAGDGNYYIYFLADGVAQYLYLNSATSSVSIATATIKHPRKLGRSMNQRNVL